MKKILWSIRELVEIFDKRRKNEFDVNLLVTGMTGLGKSTLILKFLSRFDGFNQMKHQIYSREDNIKLLRDHKFSFCWNDELITSAYKRTHYDVEQINLIQILTQYRCNYNIFCGALPVFFTLDKELLKLFAINIDVIKRGIGVIHMRRDGRRYTDDPWDTKYNAKLEERWSKRIQMNPKFIIPYHKYSTFVGYVYFNELTPKQKKKYEYIRDLKKKEIRDEKDFDSDINKPYFEKLADMIIRKEIDLKGLENISILTNKSMQHLRTGINRILADRGMKERTDELFRIIKKEKEDAIIVNPNISKRLDELKNLL